MLTQYEKRLRTRLNAGLEFVASDRCPERFKERLFDLLVFAEGNQGHGSCRGMPHTEGPHGDPADWVGFPNIMTLLCESMGYATWRVSPRSWDHIIYLSVSAG